MTTKRKGHRSALHITFPHTPEVMTKRTRGNKEDGGFVSCTTLVERNKVPRAIFDRIERKQQNVVMDTHRKSKLAAIPVPTASFHDPEEDDKPKRGWMKD